MGGHWQTSESANNEAGSRPFTEVANRVFGGGSLRCDPWGPGASSVWDAGPLTVNGMDTSSVRSPLRSALHHCFMPALGFRDQV